MAHEPEARKVVTVLFTDVAGSTALGEQLDPELLRRVMWRLETRNGHVAGHDEIVGYHLEQAYRLGAELGRRDDELALRAGRLLCRAGEAAANRDEPAAATALLGRASELLASAPAERAAMLVTLGRALRQVGLAA
jgi:hypothetical protein